MSKRILIVEDDAAMRQVLHLRLKMLQYDTVPVADAVSAMFEARKQAPDLILLDLGLPGGGGLNLMQRLQTIPRLAVIPVIVLSARERTAMEQPVLDAGAQAFFQKPADPEALMKKIRELLGETS
ncbi:MAG: response regulator [Acidobacteriota bacterium]|nr:response regulator [Acidobacteriota bacterium]